MRGAQILYTSQKIIMIDCWSYRVDRFVKLLEGKGILYHMNNDLALIHLKGWARTNYGENRAASCIVTAENLTKSCKESN